MQISTDYQTIVIDGGSGIIKAGYGGEEGPRSIFSSIVGIPKMPGLKVGMELKERYCGDEAIKKFEIMNFNQPIQQGEVSDWEKFETLMQYLLYDQMKVVPEEISILMVKAPLSNKLKRAKLAEILFETFNVKRLHLANSSMLGLFSYGKSSGLIIDSGFNITSTVPIYEGFPLTHASVKINFGGENISKNVLELIKNNIDKSYKEIKGRILADNIKETLSFVSLNGVDNEDNKEVTYELPDGKKVNLTNELFNINETLFNPSEDDVQNKGLKSLKNMIVESMDKCESEIKDDIKENICLIGGTTLLHNFPEKLKNDISSPELTQLSNFNMQTLPERQFSSWIGGSIMTSLDHFSYLWVTKKEYDENGQVLVSIDSKCF